MPRSAPSSPGRENRSGVQDHRIDVFRWTIAIVVALPLALDVCVLITRVMLNLAYGTALEGVAADALRGFEFSNESNVPTWLSSLLWAGLGVCALALAALGRSHRLSFVLMGIVGLYASLDEIAELHERLEGVGATVLPESASGFSAAWIVPGLVIAAVIALLLLRTVLLLPRRSRNWIIAGGAVFLAGSVGMESVWGILYDTSEDQFSWPSILLNILEENCEMVGVGFAIAALLDLATITRSPGRLTIGIDRQIVAPSRKDRFRTSAS